MNVTYFGATTEQLRELNAAAEKLGADQTLPDELLDELEPGAWHRIIEAVELGDHENGDTWLATTWQFASKHSGGEGSKHSGGELHLLNDQQYLFLLSEQEHEEWK